MSNRRLATRHDVVLAVTVSLGDQVIESQMNNLSIGGAEVAIRFRVAIGTPVRLRFWIPTHDQAIDVAGRDLELDNTDPPSAESVRATFAPLLAAMREQR